MCVCGGACTRNRGDPPPPQHRPACPNPRLDWADGRALGGGGEARGSRSRRGATSNGRPAGSRSQRRLAEQRRGPRRESRSRRRTMKSYAHEKQCISCKGDRPRASIRGAGRQAAPLFRRDADEPLFRRDCEVRSLLFRREADEPRVPGAAPLAGSLQSRCFSKALSRASIGLQPAPTSQASIGSRGPPGEPRATGARSCLGL